MSAPARPTVSAPVRMGAFAVSLVLVLAGALALGRWVGPFAPPAAGVHNGVRGGQDMAGGNGGAGKSSAGKSEEELAATGLRVVEDGYRLEPLTKELTAGAATELAFRVVGPDEAVLTRYTATNERELHLVVVRRDLSYFQHVHPAMSGDGIWRIPLTVPAAGQYRVFVDFQPAGHDRVLTLGVDIPAAGSYQPVALPAVARTVTVDEYTVELAGDLVPGKASRLDFRVSRAGQPVTDLQPYLGMYGHLVTLRAGDLAYLHSHGSGPAEGVPAGPVVTFYTDVPSVGVYRLYLNFQHGGVVRTATFTATAGPVQQN